MIKFGVKGKTYRYYVNNTLENCKGKGDIFEVLF